MKDSIPGYIIKNKVGLNDDVLINIEAKLFKYKSAIIDYRFTFNQEYFGIEYLLKLHEFLFGDLYDYAGKISDRYNESDKEEFDRDIRVIVSLISSKNPDIAHIADLINDFVDKQIFDDGNSRTIHLFFNNIIDCFYLDGEYGKELKEELKKTGRKL